MQLWRIVPSARPDDTRWEDHPVFVEVIVRAETAAQARLAAGRALYSGSGAIQFGAERDPIFVSAFDDEKLYRVAAALPDGRFAAEGPREVLFSQPLQVVTRAEPLPEV